MNEKEQFKRTMCQSKTEEAAVSMNKNFMKRQLHFIIKKLEIYSLKFTNCPLRKNI